jgi:pimeloyl-ACP methyl ester carboxylesterase
MSVSAGDVMKRFSSRWGHHWEDLCDVIIRPQRAEYSLKNLGPAAFRLNNASPTRYERVDVDLENMRGLKICCSWYRPAAASPQPCVVYLHGNCGSRLDAQEILHLLGEGMTVMAFDATGSGMSDGEFVSLGFYERQDLAIVIDHVQGSRRQVTAVGLWGRSMGSVASIMYAARDRSVACIVADSPFSSLRLLAADLVAIHGTWMPGAVAGGVVNKMRRSILRRAEFDLDDLDTLKYASQCAAPAFIFHGKDDDFVRYEHSVAVAEHYAGNCVHHVVQGSHNSIRRDDAKTVATAFLRLYLIDKPAAVAAAAAAMEQPAASPGPAGTAEDSADESSSTTGRSTPVTASGSDDDADDSFDGSPEACEQRLGNDDSPLHYDDEH